MCSTHSSACRGPINGLARTHRRAQRPPPASASASQRTQPEPPEHPQGGGAASPASPWASEDNQRGARRSALAPPRPRIPSSTTAPLIDLSGSNLGPRRPALADQGICSACRGAGSAPCKACGGSGSLARGGFNKRNPIPKDVIGSKWTAMAPTIGWRHFRAIKQRKSSSAAASSAPDGGGGSSGGGGAAPAKSKQTVFVLMQASCDATAQLWVNREALRDRSQWAAGWLLRSEMGISTPGVDEDADAGDDPAVAAPSSAKPVATGSKLCRLCAGTGLRVCSACDASGVQPIDV